MVEPLPWYLLHASALSVPLALLALLAGRWLMLHLGGSRARTQAAAVRERMGESADGLHAKNDGKVVTLRGELLVQGEPARRYEDAATVAATTMQVSDARTWAEGTEVNPHSDRRAETLVLATSSGRVPLEGEVTVLVGSREFWPAADIGQTSEQVVDRVRPDAGFDPRKFDGFAVFRSLSDGDEVLVKGKLVRKLKQGGGGGTYREQAASWEVHADGVAIEIASAKPPKFVTKERLQLAGPGLALAAALLAYTWLFVDKDPGDEAKACGYRCHEYGQCRPVVKWKGLGPGLDCVMIEHPPCETMTACRHEGRCVERGGVCVAERAEDCHATLGCVEQGRCSVVAGRCALTSDEDCARTNGCGVDGRCTMVGEASQVRICEIGKDEDCARRSSCHLRGMCSFVDGYCVAAKDADCVQSRYCRDEGLCQYDAETGCVAGNDDQCEASRACSLQERCVAAGGLCRTRVAAQHWEQFRTE